MNSKNEEDEFWQVALNSGCETRRYFAQSIDRDEDDCEDDDEHSEDGGLKTAAESNGDDDGEWLQIIRGARSITYQIPWRKPADFTDGNEENDTLVVPTFMATIPLQLSPLPDTDGIWSPLGAQAWHASSLLVAYMLQHTILLPPDGTTPTVARDRQDQQQHHSMETETGKSLFSKHLDRYFFQDGVRKEKARFTALELGSGALGLAGIVLGLILGEYDARSSRHCTTTTASTSSSTDGSASATNHPKPPTIILSDNEPDVLTNLKQNVHTTVSWLERERTSLPISMIPNFQVTHLDWGDPTDSLLLFGQPIHLVIGSELVYTHETAKACATAVTAILQANPEDALVFILQVTDRDGWTNIFLPTLRNYRNNNYDNHNDLPMLQVVEVPMHNSDLHELAGAIVPPGGTLDRFAFGGCYIFHRNSSLAALYNGNTDTK